MVSAYYKEYCTCYHTCLLHQIQTIYPSVEERVLFRLCYDGTLVYTLLQASGFVPTSQTGVWSIYSQQCEVVGVQWCVEHVCMKLLIFCVYSQCANGNESLPHLVSVAMTESHK